VWFEFAQHGGSSIGSCTPTKFRLCGKDVKWYSFPVVSTNVNGFNVIKISAIGNSYSVAINNTPIATIYRAGFSSGRVGVWTKELWAIGNWIDVDYFKLQKK
jgi:hypothetical protein